MLRVQAAKEKETEAGQGISHINHQSGVRTMVLNKLSHRWVEIDEEESEPYPAAVTALATCTKLLASPWLKGLAVICPEPVLQERI